MREFQADGRTISGYLAVPEHGSGPGVLVLHAWWGLTEPFRQGCDHLPAEGLFALTLDRDHPDLAARALEVHALGAARGPTVARGLGEDPGATAGPRPPTTAHP